MLATKTEKDKSRPGFPYAETKIAIYIGKQIDALREENLTQAMIAQEIGYDRPNMLSMIKNGQSKVPLDRIPDFARALRVDPGHLFRLAMEQYWTGQNDALNSILGNTVTENEQKGVIAAHRAATGDDPKLSKKDTEALTKVLKDFYKERKIGDHA